MSEVSVYLCAGLGNRMFQYASVKGLSHRYGFSFRVHSYDTNRQHNNNNYDWFIRDVLRLENVQNIDTPQFKATYNTDIWEQPVEQHIGYHEIESKTIENRVAYGFFQSEKYFAHIADTIRRDFQAPTSMTSFIRSYLVERNIAPDDNDLTIIHFRFGDFLCGDGKHFINLDEYYKHCIQTLSEDSPIILITEEPATLCIVYPDLVRLLEQRQAPVYVAPALEEHCECFHLYLMTYAKTVICSNSTFAWWGAWLNSRKDKTVFLPDRMINAPYPSMIDMKGATYVHV